MNVLDLLTAPWAIMPGYQEQLLAIYNRHIRGEGVDLQELEARRGAPLPGPVQGYEVRDGVAIVPIEGVMSPRMNLMANVSGGTSTELLARDVRAATADPKIKGIILKIHSPGGAVLGTQDAAAAVLAARGVKPVFTLVDGLMASAGVWVGSAAEERYISSMVDQVGSIGVAMQHVDKSRMQENAGIKVTDIYAGKYKRIATENAPLTEAGRADLQHTVDTIYSIFVGDVANHLGVSVEKVLSDMADGRLFIGQQAIDAGLVDGVASLDQLVAEVRDRAKWRPLPSGGSRVKMSTTAASNGPPPNGSNSTMNITEQVAQWAAENPDGAAALRAEGAAAERARLNAEHETALAKAREQGAASERDRVAGVRAASLPGHEALIERLAADGHTTPTEAALAVLTAERELRSAAVNARVTTPAPAVGYVAPPDGLEAKAGQTFGPVIDASTDQDALHQAAIAYQANHPGCDYVTALNAITQGGN